MLPTGLRIQLAPTLSSLTVNSSKFLAAVHCCARALILRKAVRSVVHRTARRGRGAGACCSSARLLSVAASAGSALNLR